ncbi:MAG: hypothetical protein ABMA64_24380 [Myxococcota bacterium]
MFEDVGRTSTGAWLAGCAATTLAVGVAVLGCAGLGYTWWTRVPSVAPPSTYGWVVPPERRSLGGVDLEQVHRQGWVQWVLTRDDRARVTREIVASVAADPGLATIAADLGAQTDASGLGDQVALWNAALAARGAWWALGAGIDIPTPYVKAYALVARPTVSFGDRTERVQVGLRADRLSVVEGWLGLADDVGEAMVVVDRVADFSADVLWPALDPEDHSPWAPAARAEIARAVGPDAAARLTATAPARRRMVAARDAVDGRRERCGSRFSVRFGWDGLDRLGELYAWADAERAEGCPGITRSEADALARGTLALRADPELPAAFERLVGFAARHVVVHEARHQLDHGDWGMGVPPPSDTAPIDGRARIEASAYLAALTSDEALVAWVQGCELVQRSSGGSAYTALVAIGRAMSTSCDAAPPPDLAERARRVHDSWFGPAPVITVTDLPPALPFAMAPFTE